MKLITFILHQIMCPFWLQLVHSCYRKLVHCKLPITGGRESTNFLVNYGISEIRLALF